MLERSHLELATLRSLSASLGRNPMLVQASTGNTSIKIDGVLWIKASGKWLRTAEQDDIFVAVPLSDIKASLSENRDFTSTYSTASGEKLSASIETTMHGVLPHRVVVHVHSVHTITWAVRQDGPLALVSRLYGLNWEWIPYMPSGRLLARIMERASRHLPLAKIFVLANHGLVICGSNCSEVEDLLWEVERRLSIAPRGVDEPDVPVLREIAGSEWQLPNSRVVHALATDFVTRRILSQGVLYPCQNVFLPETTPAFLPIDRPAGKGANHLRSTNASFLILEEAGVLLRNDITNTECEMLVGLAEVLQRINPDAPIRYLSQEEIDEVSTQDAYRYRQLAQSSSRRLLYSTNS